MPKLERMPMRHPAKLFGLVAIATLIAPTIQTPAFSATAQPPQLHPKSSRVLAQATDAADRFAEARRLHQQGIEQYNVSQFQAALQSCSNSHFGEKLLNPL